MADRLAFGFTTSGLTSNNSQDKHVLNCTRQSVQYRAPARACCSYKLHGPIPYSSFSNSAVLARVLIMYVLKHRQTTNRRTSSYLLTFEKKVHTPAEARLTSLNTLSGTETLFQGQRHSFRDRDTLSWWVVVVEVVVVLIGLVVLFCVVFLWSSRSG
jgi:hypothetical protein